MARQTLTGIDDTLEQFVHDLGQALGGQLAVQRTHEHRFTRIEFLRRGLDVVGIGNDPRNHLDLGTNRMSM